LYHRIFNSFQREKKVTKGPDRNALLGAKKNLGNRPLWRGENFCREGENSLASPREGWMLEKKGRKKKKAQRGRGKKNPF